MSGTPWVWPPILSNNGGGTSDTVTNDSGVPGAKVTNALNTLLADSTPSPYASSGDPSWDLEARKLASPDLALAGWTVALQNSPWTVLTRNGDVDATTAGAPVGTYNSSLVNGVLVMQGPVSPSAPIQIFRATDGLAHTYVFHVWCENYQNGNSDYCFFSNESKFRQNVTTQFMYCGLEQAAPRHSVIVKIVGTSGGVTLYYNQQFENYQQDLVRYINWHAGGNQTRFTFGTPNGQLVEANSPQIDGTPTPNYVGVWMNAVLNHCFYIDFIRRLPENRYP